MEGRSRREWKLTLQTLKLIDVGWSDLLEMSSGDAWKWLGWDSARFCAWTTSLDVARSRLSAGGELSIQVVTELDADVPPWLQRLTSVPWVFYRGDLSMLDQKTIGFSGQRDASTESCGIASTLVANAVHDGYTIVSGGARGIDTVAHVSALDSGGDTAVILPQGLATWRVPHAIDRRRMLALSEDLPWDGWTTESAMRRNRMIVEISNIFTVPQSGTSGGSHSTGMFALRQGRVTYVPDLGPDFPGNRKLLSHGARLLVPQNGVFNLEQMFRESTPEEGPAQTTLF